MQKLAAALDEDQSRLLVRAANLAATVNPMPVARIVGREHRATCSAHSLFDTQCVLLSKSSVFLLLLIVWQNLWAPLSSAAFDQHRCTSTALFIFFDSHFNSVFICFHAFSHFPLPCLA